MPHDNIRGAAHLLARAALALACLATSTDVMAAPPLAAARSVATPDASLLHPVENRKGNGTQSAPTTTARTSPEGEMQRARSWPMTLESKRMGLGMSPATMHAAKPKPTEPARKIVWQRRADCLDHNLQIVIDEVAERFGAILVTSTCRNPEHNRRVGGVKNSQHIGGHAVDFYLYGDVSKARQYLRDHRSVGGLGYYGSGRFHVDNGPIRNW